MVCAKLADNSSIFPLLFPISWVCGQPALVVTQENVEHDNTFMKDSQTDWRAKILPLPKNLKGGIF